MKNGSKPLLSLMLCAVIIFTLLLAGCGQQEQQQTTAAQSQAQSQNTAATTAKPAEPLKIRILNRVNAEVMFDKNPIYEEIEKLANVDLEIEAPPINNYGDRLKIVMASGDLPDIICTGGGADYDMWAKDGLLIELDGKVDNFPNIMKNVEKNMWETARSTVTGKLHAIPRPNLTGRYGMIIRNDWLEKLGLKAPETLEEFKIMCDAFVNRDPDGNGKPDTYAFSTSWGMNSNYMNFLMNAFDTTVHIGAPDTDGQYKSFERKSAFFPYMTFLREAYEKKWLDNEFFLNKSYGEREKIIQQRIGMIPLHDVETGNIANVYPEGIKTISYYPPLNNSKGEKVNYYPPAVWNQFAVTNAAKDVNGVLGYIDFCFGETGHKLIALGVEGVHYNSYDLSTRKLDRTEEQSKLLTTLTSTYCQFSLTYDGQPLIPPVPSLPGMLEKYFGELEAYNKVTKSVSVPSIVSPKLAEFNANNPDLVKKKNEMDTKYVIGEITLEEYKGFYENEYFPKSGDAEKELSEKAAAAAK